MHALRKGQAAIFNLTGDARGEARLVERAFGLGQSALAEDSSLSAHHLHDTTAENRNHRAFRAI